MLIHELSEDELKSELQRRQFCAKDQRRLMRMEERERAAKAMAEHKADLERQCGVESNPKRDLLYEKAWDAGHSSGFGEVSGIYRDLVDLIR